MIEIVVASGKGGVGKTTLSSSLAILLARDGYRVVAADADAEAPNLHLVLGVTSWDSVEDYIEGRVAYIRQDKCIGCGDCMKACSFGAIEYRDEVYRVNPWICEGCFTCSFVCPVKAVSFRYGVKAGEIRVRKDTGYGFPLVSGRITPGRPNSGKLVTEVKNRAKAMLGGKGVLIVDAAAGIGCQVISSLAGADIVIAVAEPTPSSFSDLKRLGKLAKHFGLPMALAVNKADINPGFLEEIKSYAGEENIDFLGTLPYDEAVPRSMASMKPVIEACPDSEVARALVGIYGRVKAILEDWDRWRLDHVPARIEPFIPLTRRPVFQK